MSVPVLLRSLALAIAVAALVDPALTRNVPTRGALTVVAMDDASLPVAQRVAERMRAGADTATWRHSSTSAASACPARGDCVLVSGGELPEHLSAGARIVGVVDARSRETGVVQRIDVPLRVHRDAVARLRLQTSRPVTRVEVYDEATLVGTADATEQRMVDVPWVPIDTGARVLRVVADGETAQVGVIVSAQPAEVMFYEPQATWLGTFVRRALEHDGRFALRGRTRLAPPVSITRGTAATLNVATLDAVSTVIVTAPELLTESDVGLLERFVTVRGGSLLVLTDRRPSGAALRLLPRVVHERRDPQPQAAGALRATEWVTFDADGIGVATIAAIEEQPVVVSRMVGRGRVIVSGALDAWRFRQADDRFDDFWTGLVWDASVVAGPALRIDADRIVARPGEPVAIHVERFALSGLADDSENAAGRFQCGAAQHFVRLWPGARPGEFHGAVRAESEGPCEVSVRVGAESASVPVTFRDNVDSVAMATPRFEAVAAAYGAPMVAGDQVDELVAGIHAGAGDVQEQQAFRPMRSPYWLIPFVACLASEWWLRRRTGLS